MTLLGNLLGALARLLHLGLMIYLWVIIFRAVLSWVRVPSLYPAAVVLYRLTEPVLRPVRRLLPPERLGGLDLSPVVVGLIIVVIDSVLVGSLSAYAHRLLRGEEINF
ncbi:MAG: YggT family protein [Acidobacteriota bacterium]